VAFALLVERYGRTAKAVAYGVLRDHHLAEDAAQEAFVLGHRHLGRLLAPGLFGRWLLAIAKRQALSSKRKLKVQLPIDAAQQVESPRSVDHGLLDEVMALPETQRRLVMLRFFSGYTVGEIAKITDQPIGTVTKQMSRAYERLRGRASEVLQ
jgi:RNA polymerase sigma-70 factor (ECF subfamily)